MPSSTSKFHILLSSGGHHLDSFFFFSFLSFSLTFPLLFGHSAPAFVNPFLSVLRLHFFFSALLTPRTILGGGGGVVGWFSLTLLQWLEHTSPVRFPRHTSPQKESLVSPHSSSASLPRAEGIRKPRAGLWPELQAKEKLYQALPRPLWSFREPSPFPSELYISFLL